MPVPLVLLNAASKPTAVLLEAVLFCKEALPKAVLLLTRCEIVFLYYHLQVFELTELKTETYCRIIATRRYSSTLDNLLP
jgi:hypothetical protein